MANVSQGGRTKQGIRNGMQQHVGITVSVQVLVKGDLRATNPQGSTGNQAVGVISQPNPHHPRDGGRRIGTG